jgi:hypothetical protein
VSLCPPCDPKPYACLSKSAGVPVERSNANEGRAFPRRKIAKLWKRRRGVLQSTGPAPGDVSKKGLVLFELGRSFMVSARSQSVRVSYFANLLVWASA